MKPQAKRLLQQDPEIYTVTKSKKQDEFQTEAYNHFCQLSSNVNAQLIDEDFKISTKYESGSGLMSSDIGQLKGQIKVLEDNLPSYLREKSDLRKSLGTLEVILGSIEIAETIGIPSALEVLKENGILLSNVEKFNSCWEKSSPRQAVSL